MESLYRRLPAVQRLLEDPVLEEEIERWGHDAVAEACRREVEEVRRRIDGDELSAADVEAAAATLPRRVRERLEVEGRSAYPGVINATGVLIHTNLGRAPLPAPSEALTGYLALEYDLAAGRRGQRLAPLARRIARTCAAEAAVMVNNNAAALLLALSTHAKDREVVVSRSQLIEIGGSFRLPDVMAASGCVLVEVGCTNRTHLRDYERAIGPDTAAILVAHQSNFRIVGFTTEPEITELAELAHRHDLPLLVDQGSGALHDVRRWGLAGEPTVGELLQAGADVVCFSGDKLLGGPQAGILVGPARWIEPLARHPLYRALRPDKSALVLMERVLTAHQRGRLEEIPLYALLEVDVSTLRRRAGRLRSRLRARGVPAAGVASRATLGGGTTPEETFPSHALAVPGGQQLADRLRAASPAVIGRLEDDRVLLDLRAVWPHQDGHLVEAVAEAYSGVVQAIHDDGR